ncbi:MAG: hypothetical protein ACOX54_10660 [Christensenellales bacterium]|jgi:hypothetical protein
MENNKKEKASSVQEKIEFETVINGFKVKVEVNDENKLSLIDMIELHLKSMYA